MVSYYPPLTIAGPTKYDITGLQYFPKLIPLDIEYLLEEIKTVAKPHRSKRHMQVWIEDFGKVSTEVLYALLAQFNVTLVDAWFNWYREGEDKAWHHDNFHNRYPVPTITIVLSLGKSHRALFRDAKTYEEANNINMEHGDVIGFDAEYNAKHQHSVISEVNEPTAPRLSLVIWGLPNPLNESNIGGAPGVRTRPLVPAIVRSNPNEPITCVTLLDVPCLDVSTVTEGFTVQGPQMARAMLLGKKKYENRGWIIPPGWYALHVGAKEEITDEQRQQLEITYPDCPPASSLERSCIVGFVLLGVAVTPENAENKTWAVGPFCHPILNTSILPRPIKASGQQKLWKMEKMRGKLPLSL